MFSRALLPFSRALLTCSRDVVECCGALLTFVGFFCTHRDVGQDIGGKQLLKEQLLDKTVVRRKILGLIVLLMLPEFAVVRVCVCVRERERER